MTTRQCESEASLGPSAGVSGRPLSCAAASRRTDVGAMWVWCCGSRCHTAMRQGWQRLPPRSRWSVPLGRRCRSSRGPCLFVKEYALQKVAEYHERRILRSSRLQRPARFKEDHSYSSEGAPGLPAYLDIEILSLTLPLHSSCSPSSSTAASPPRHSALSSTSGSRDDHSTTWPRMCSPGLISGTWSRANGSVPRDWCRPFSRLEGLRGSKGEEV